MPHLPRPFKVPGNIRWRGKEVPLFIISGTAFMLGVWGALLFFQPYSRYVGLSWMVLGLALYFLYRRRAGLSMTEVAPKLEVLD